MIDLQRSNLRTIEVPAHYTWGPPFHEARPGRKEDRNGHNQPSIRFFLMGPWEVASPFSAFSPKWLIYTATRRTWACDPSLGNRYCYLFQPLIALHGRTAAHHSSDRRADLPPALPPFSRILFNCISGVYPPHLTFQLSSGRTYATAVASGAAFATADPSTRSPADLRPSPQSLLPKDGLLAALEAVRRSADAGSLYLLESRLAEAFPEHVEAKAKVEAIRELVQHLQQLKQEKARLVMFRHQTPKEIRSEYAQMMLTGLFTGLAAAIHPIFFIGTIGGLVRIRRTKRAEVDRDAGTKKMDELNRAVKEKRAALKAHIDALARIVGL